MMLRRTLPLLALAASTIAWGQALDPPERIARLSYVEGEVQFQAAHGRVTSDLPERPLEPGDRLFTRTEGRAELAFGSATIRLDEQSEFAVVDLDEAAVRIELATGTASVGLDSLLENETFRIDTPNAAIALKEPGEYRVDVRDDRLSVLTVRTGAAEVATAGGPVRVAANQRVRLEGRDSIARLETPRPADAFDDWVLERELLLADAEPARYTPYEGGGYDEFDRHGDWYDEPRYGRVWMPGYGYSDWSPYGGYWQRSGFGWGWYDPAPWGYFSYYGGRWIYLRDRQRWAWIPAPSRHPRHRGIPESAPRTADRGSNAGNAPAPVLPAPSAPRRIDPDRRPAPAREIPADQRPRGGTYAPRDNREPGSAAPVGRPAVPVAQPAAPVARPAAPAASPPRDKRTGGPAGQSAAGARTSEPGNFAADEQGA